jgi:5-formyltetrahydrofolate cyclo-ligase
MVNLMDEKENVRRQVWIQLHGVAKPDSRFHWDFSQFIPDFEGSTICAERLINTPTYRTAERVLVTPDNSLADFRARCIVDGKTLIVPTYGLIRGLISLNRETVPAGQEAFAGTLDGLDVFGSPYLTSISDHPSGPQMMVTGASVLNSQGIRISTGPSFFDLEWIILSSLGLVDDRIPILAVVHDCQLVDLICAPLPYEVGIDQIITPTRLINTGRPYIRPSPDSIKTLAWQITQDIPLLCELTQ